MPEEEPAASSAPFIPRDADAPPMPPAPWRLFGSKSFFRLWLAQVVSSLGDWIGLIAILADRGARCRTTRVPRSAS